MANIRLIKNRIRSAKNIAQITKAMELVAASKMKKAQMQAQAGKLYAQKIYDMVMKLATRVEYEDHPLMRRPKELTGKRLVVVISSNKGLSGGLNANLFRFLAASYGLKSEHEYLTVGQKGADFLVRTGNTISADFSSGTSFSASVPAINDYVRDRYVEGAYDGVDLVFSEFLSAINQRPKKKTILPLTIQSAGEEEEHAHIGYTIEPSIPEVFESLLPHYLENQIRDAVLQAEASEHSARMVAMRNATDNAMSLMDELTLQYNKIRQEKITYEITDLITARLASEQ